MDAEYKKKRVEDYNDFCRTILPLVEGGYVCGGAAVDCTRAGDIDVFYTRVERGYSTRTVEELKAELREKLPPGMFVENGMPMFTEEGMYNPQSCPIGNGLYGLFKVQFIYVNAQTVQEILNYFDLSVHMVGVDAFRDSMCVYYGKDWTATYEPIKVCNVFDPVRTYARLLKLAQRYDTTVDKASADALKQTVDLKYYNAIHIVDDVPF